MRLHRDMLVDEVMRRWPATIRCFLKLRMKCVGCPFATFHTIADACIEHEAIEADFMRLLERTIRESEASASAQQAEPAGAGPG